MVGHLTHAGSTSEQATWKEREEGHGSLGLLAIMAPLQCWGRSDSCEGATPVN